MKTEVDSIMLFIAELTGSYVAGSGTEEDKTECGRTDYITNHLPELDLDSEEDRKDVHELIWLKRLYKELDDYFMINEGDCIARGLSLNMERYRPHSEHYKWSVPVELDAGASMLQYMAILLNDKRLLEMTNMTGEVLNDPWKIKGLSRQKVKKASTPMLYGSSQQCHELWQDNKLDYTKEDIALYSKEMKDGAFGLCNLFKEFIINNAKPKASMMVNINGEQFTVDCNRWRNVGEKTKAYKAWDSVDKRYNLVLHTDTKKIPDLQQFARYFVTCLIHNLDSQVCDTVSEKVYKKYGWIIPIYDAFIVSPAAALDVRIWYAQEMEKIYCNRNKILADYFASIGISGAAISQWEDIKAKVHEFTGNLQVGLMALK